MCDWNPIFSYQVEQQVILACHYRKSDKIYNTIHFGIIWLNVTIHILLEIRIDSGIILDNGYSPSFLFPLFSFLYLYSFFLLVFLLLLLLLYPNCHTCCVCVCVCLSCITILYLHQNSQQKKSSTAITNGTLLSHLSRGAIHCVWLRWLWYPLGNIRIYYIKSKQPHYLFVMQSVEINSKLHHVAISRSTWSSLFVWKSVITVNNVNPKRRSPIAMIESISALVKQRTEIWRRDYIEFEIYHVFNAQRCSDGHMLVLEINMELIVYIWQRLIHMHLIH